MCLLLLNPQVNISSPASTVGNALSWHMRISRFDKRSIIEIGHGIFKVGPMSERETGL